MKKLLLVIDMQNDFISGSLGTKEAIAIVPRVMKKILEFDGDLLFTKDTHAQNYMATQEGKHLPVQHCVKGTDGWRLDPMIEKAFLETGGKIIEKNTFGAKQLPELLAKDYPEGVASFELCGLCTDICVISNALLLKAYYPETPIFVDASCCAGVSPESHDNALKAMQMCQITIL